MADGSVKAVRHICDNVTQSAVVAPAERVGLHCEGCECLKEAHSLLVHASVGVQTEGHEHCASGYGLAIVEAMLVVGDRVQGCGWAEGSGSLYVAVGVGVCYVYVKEVGVFVQLAEDVRAAVRVAPVFAWLFVRSLLVL